MDNFHLLRPIWLGLLILIPLIVLFIKRIKKGTSSWEGIGDPDLIGALLCYSGKKQHFRAIAYLLLSLFFMIIALSGPTWQRLPIPTYHVVQPRVIVLSLSENMLEKDIQPNRLARAKFIIHDLLAQPELGQIGMVVYTGEPFVLSPLTQDGKTIDALLPSLQPEVMPITGDNLASALQQAAELIKRAGYSNGQLIVLSATPPDSSAVENAKALAQKNINTSIIPMFADTGLTPIFQPLAKAGEGIVIPYNQAQAPENWLKFSAEKQQFVLSQQNDIPLWRDEGRWFIIPALAFLLPVFRRDWLQRLQA